MLQHILYCCSLGILKNLLWSRGQFRVAVMHHYIKFTCDKRNLPVKGINFPVFLQNSILDSVLQILSPSFTIYSLSEIGLIALFYLNNFNGLLFLRTIQMLTSTVNHFESEHRPYVTFVESGA